MVDGERDHTFFAVEEPEAHLHPHVQRFVYRYFLGGTAAGEEDAPALTTILTTHSPHITSVTPVRSVVLLRHDTEAGATATVSTARALHATRRGGPPALHRREPRKDVLRAGVILVESDAERFLVPAFAEALDFSLDMLGISVCSVGGAREARDQPVTDRVYWSGDVRILQHAQETKPDGNNYVRFPLKRLVNQ